MKPFDRALQLVLLLFGFLFVGKLCQSQTDTFTIWGCASNRPYHEEFATPTPKTPELEEALAQRYTYFGRGGQAFAFFSEDGKYVIKLFRQRLFRPSLLLKLHPIGAMRKKRIAKRLDKWARDFFSYKIAFTELQEVTGLLYTHLNRTSHLKTKLAIRDKLHIWHTIDLDQFDFVLQKKAEGVHDRIDRLMSSENIEGAKQALAQVFSLIDTRARKGFRDRDPNIQTNCGFIGNQAIKIDVGRFVRSEEMAEPANRKNEIQRITTPFGEWLQEVHPSLVPTFRSLQEAYGLL